MSACRAVQVAPRAGPSRPRRCWRPSPSPAPALRRLEWTVIRRLDGLLQGDYRTLMRGTGLDLADLREYQLHDDVRHIDWNVTARMQQPHVRVFTEDREMAAWFLLDLSASVDFGSGEQRKRRVSSEFVAVLARLLTRHGNRVGAMFYGSGVESVLLAGSGGRTCCSCCTDAAAMARGRRTGGTRLSELAGSPRRRHPPPLHGVRGVGLHQRPGWERPLAQLAQRHEVVGPCACSTRWSWSCPTWA